MYFFLICTLLLSILAVLVIVIVFIHQRKVLKHSAELQTLSEVSHEEMIRSHMQSQEDERKKITADMHDEIGPLLSIVKMNISQVADKLTDETQKESLVNSKKILEDAIQQIRNISKSLYSEVLYQFGLVGGLEEFIQVMQLKTKIKMDVIDEGMGDNRFSKILETNIFRIVQEMVNNIIKYSEATKMIVKLAYTDNMLIVSICDNGQHFNMLNKKDGTGQGLMNIESRLNTIKGTLTYLSDTSFKNIIEIKVKTSTYNELYENS